MKENAAKDAHDTVKELQRQFASLTGKAEDIKAKTETATAEHDAKIGKLSGQLQAVKDRYHKLHFRHELEVQGYAAEGRQLQSRLKQIKRFGNI
jgi:hypothetical protein